MDDSSLKIPKKPMPVTLWVHPEGRVVGSIFLHLPGPDTGRGEQPLDVMNEPTDFLVIQREPPEGVRFYNKASIVRLEYWDGAEAAAADGRPLPCHVTLMDGSMIDGALSKAAPVERSRLYDCMNDPADRFLKLLTGANEIILINKSYVVCINPAEPAPAVAQPPDSDPGTPGPLELAA
jgi:hypothetical protein